MHNVLTPPERNLHQSVKIGLFATERVRAQSIPHVVILETGIRPEDRTDGCRLLAVHK